jgi:hypothetical protein
MGQPLNTSTNAPDTGRSITPPATNNRLHPTRAAIETTFSNTSACSCVTTLPEQRIRQQLRAQPCSRQQHSIPAAVLAPQHGWQTTLLLLLTAPALPRTITPYQLRWLL